MFPMHLENMLRMCGASTIAQVAQGMGIKVNNLTPAAQGDPNTHMMLGQLINIIPHNVMLGGSVPAIPSIAAMSAPDMLTPLIPHPTGLPTPAQGSPNVFIGMMGGMGGLGGLGGLGNMLGGGFGNIIGGNLGIGELVSIGQQVVGMVSSFTPSQQIAGGASVQLSNLQGPTINPGSTLTGQTTGNSLQLRPFIDGRVEKISGMGGGLGNREPIFSFIFGIPFIIGYHSLTIGEYVTVNGNRVGQIQNFVEFGAGNALALISALRGRTLVSGDVLLGESSGRVFTLSDFYDNRINYFNALDNTQTILDAAKANNSAVNNDLSTYRNLMYPITS